MSPLVIVNPRSGGGRAGRTFTEVRGVLERRLGSLDVVLTTHSGHAIELAREAAVAGTGLVIAVGGDGTLHE
ncbi:MAG TPA: acylglycerol kinase family protein, partial [Polyangiaceae bacterium]|nr:acylglycerol kinase family protein [Polyangiaceae bacterium]